MKIEQVYELVNNSTKEILGETDIVNQDLSNIVDIGNKIISTDNIDNYVKSLVNHIGKVIFINRHYSGNVPTLLMDNWEFGSILEKIDCELPEAKENKSWELVDGQDYSPNVFYKPSVSAKFFNSKVTFEVDMSFTDKQVKESFSNSEQLNAFYSMLYNAVERSMTVKIDSLISSTINNAVAQVVNHNAPDVNDNNYGNATSYPQFVNLLKIYNDTYSTSLTSVTCMKDKDFLKWCGVMFATTQKRLSKMSTLFNCGGKPRFTPENDLISIFQSDFILSVKSNLMADIFNKDDISFAKITDTVPYWQGSGDDYSLSKCQKIDVTIKVDNNGVTTTKNIVFNGLVGVMFDKNAMGVTNLDRRVTTNHNPKGEFWNNFYKFDCGYFNDLDENIVIFFIADSTTNRKATK